MPSLLAIQVSPRFESSTSRKLTALFVEQWRTAHPDGGVVPRDLARTPTDVEIILADRGHAGMEGETAVEQFGGRVTAAAA